MKSGFVQLVVKRALSGRAPLKADNSSSQRYRPIDSFRSFIKNSLPKMQQAIQVQLLKKNLLKIKQEPLRKELINAYLRRLYRLRAYQQDQMKSYKQLKAIEPQQIRALKDPTIFKNINDHNEFDVGSYIMFQQQQMNKVFKHKCFGLYSQQEYKFTKKFGVQIRQESVSIGSLIKMINQRKNYQVDWSKFQKMSQQQKQEYVNDENNYPLLFTALSNQIYAKIQKYRDLPEYNRVWGSSTISDIIINSVLQHTQSLHQSVSIALDIVDEVMKIDPLPSSNDFSYRIRKMPKYQHIQTKIQMPLNARFYCRTPSFKSFFLGGEGGTGRSMILAYLSMLAFRNNWIVINVPNAHFWTHDTKCKYPRAFNGLYLINEHVVQWLDQFITANSHILSEKKVNMDIYGKHDITGTHQDHADPVQNIYYEDRKTYFDEVSKKFEDRIPQHQEEKRRQAKKRLTDILPSPKNIAQIAQIGIKNPQYATCAMAELLHQVYALDHPTLECVDSFTHLYRATYYPSFRYYNDRELYGKVPPYHIAHCRMFVNLDGHKIKNGFKVVASSNYPFHKMKFNIKQMMFPENYEHKVRNLTKEQFNLAGQFNIINKWWLADQVQRLNINYAYTITQGNWGDFQSYVKFGHYY